MVLKSVGVFSAGKISGLLYAGVGLIAGVFVSMFSFLGAFASMQSEGAFIGLIMGVGAVIVLPVLYGVMGFVGGIIGAFLYNLIAGLVGGFELELE